MKMTMKNELTLKHGVILAAAVLLIAGCAFAGVAAADPVHKTWDSTNVSYMASNGGDYIIDVDGTAIKSIGIGTVADNLTLDFNYKTYTTSSTTGGVIGLRFSVKPDKVLTIKNLVLDGGSVTGSDAGGIGGYFNYNSKNSTVFILENITVKNLSITGNGEGFTGGILGAEANGNAVKFVNCTVENCSINGVCAGGLLGIPGSSGGYYELICMENCKVLDTYISGSSLAGGLLAHDGMYVSSVISDCLVKNCIVSSTNEAGIFMSKSYVNRGSQPSRMHWACTKIGVPTTLCTQIIGCEGINNVVVSSSGVSGGVVGDLDNLNIGSDVLTIENNTISSSTIVSQASSGKAGGFAGKLKQASVHSVSNNTITNCCVVATDGDAAGFCPAVE